MIVSTVRTNHSHMNEPQGNTFCTTLLLSSLFLSLPPKEKQETKEKDRTKDSILYMIAIWLTITIIVIEMELGDQPKKVKV